MKCDITDIPNAIGIPITFFAFVGIATVAVVVCTVVCIAWRQAVEARARQIVDKGTS